MMGRWRGQKDEPVNVDDPGHAMVDRLPSLHSPRDKTVAERLDHIRFAYKDAGHALVDTAPDTEDRRIAVHKLHEACQAAIFAAVGHQDDPG